MYTQESCDPNDPRQHVLWGLMFLPNVGGAPTVTHPDILKDWSERLYKLGFRHHPELQELKFVEPKRGGQTNYNASGGWVPIDTPEQPKLVIPDISKLTPEENELMLQQYRAAGMIPDAAPEPRKAMVIGDES